MRYIITVGTQQIVANERRIAKVCYQALNAQVAARDIDVEVYDDDNLLDVAEIAYIRK